MLKNLVNSRGIHVAMLTNLHTCFVFIIIIVCYIFFLSLDSFFNIWLMGLNVTWFRIEQLIWMSYLISNNFPIFQSTLIASSSVINSSIEEREILDENLSVFSRKTHFIKKNPWLILLSFKNYLCDVKWWHFFNNKEMTMSKLF